LVILAANDNRVPPPPFWRTGYFVEAMTRPDRRTIDLDDVKRGLEQPTYQSVQPDGRRRHWVWVNSQQRWLRIIVEPDGETVHNAFFDRNFKR
jgi:hypothetical protein